MKKINQPPDFPEFFGDFPYTKPPFGGPGRVRFGHLQIIWAKLPFISGLGQAVQNLTGLGSFTAGASMRVSSNAALSNS